MQLSPSGLDEALDPVASIHRHSIRLECLADQSAALWWPLHRFPLIVVAAHIVLRLWISMG